MGAWAFSLAASSLATVLYLGLPSLVVVQQTAAGATVTTLIAIPRDSQNVEAALDFLLWATTAEQMKRSAERGNPPTRKSLFSDAGLLAKNPAYPAQLRSLETSRPRPRTPQWNEIENAFGIFLSKANSGELSPADAMNQANAEIEKILQRGR